MLAIFSELFLFFWSKLLCLTWPSSFTCSLTPKSCKTCFLLISFLMIKVYMYHCVAPGPHQKLLNRGHWWALHREGAQEVRNFGGYIIWDKVCIVKIAKAWKASTRSNAL